MPLRCLFRRCDAPTTTDDDFSSHDYDDVFGLDMVQEDEQPNPLAMLDATRGAVMRNLRTGEPANSNGPGAGGNPSAHLLGPKG